MGQCSERASVQGSERACVWFWYTVWVCVWCISNVCERAFPFVLVEWVVEVWVANATYINHDVCPAVTIVIPATRLKQNPSGSALLLDSHLCTRTHRSANGPNVFVCWGTLVLVSAPCTYLISIDATKCFPLFSHWIQPTYHLCMSVGKTRAVILATVNKYKPFSLLAWASWFFLSHTLFCSCVCATGVFHITANFPPVLVTCTHYNHYEQVDSLLLISRTRFFVSWYFWLVDKSAFSYRGKKTWLCLYTWGRT